MPDLEQSAKDESRPAGNSKRRNFLGDLWRDLL